MCELVDDFNTCQDEEYATAEHIADLKTEARGVMRLLNGYMNYLANKKEEAQSR